MALHVSVASNSLPLLLSVNPAFQSSGGGEGSHSDRVPEDEALMLRHGSRTACVGQQVPAEESEVRS